MKIRREKEKDIQRIITDYLALKKIFFWRNNSGAFKTDSGRMYWFGKRGSSDIFALRAGIFYAIEIKAKEGKVSEDQQNFLQEIELNGGIGIIARSLDDIIKVF